jgi:AcrR family transcriptional regulator
MKKASLKTDVRRGGRPSRDQAGKIEDKILNAAATLFFSEGYGAVSIEEIVRRAQISKRTFYARYDNKAAIFRAVVMRVIQRLRPSDNSGEEALQDSDAETALRKIAPIVLRLSLTREALSLYRLALSEAQRFPELAQIMYEHSGREGLIRRITEILQRAAQTKNMKLENPVFAAEQFVFLLSGLPQRRALGMGVPLKVEEYDKWSKDVVDFFWRGCWG